MGIIWSDCEYDSFTAIKFKQTLNYTGEGGELSPTDLTPSRSTETTESYNLELSSSLTMAPYGSEKYSKLNTFAYKFTTPKGKINFNFFKFKFVVMDIDSKKTMRYAIKTSDSNLKYYNYGKQSYSDQIAEGQISTSSWSQYNTSEIIVESLSLEPDTSYYLVIYYNTRSTTNTSDSNRVLLSHVASQVGFKGGLVNIDSVEYTCCIDLEDDYYMYQPYIDNGTDWDPL